MALPPYDKWLRVAERIDALRIIPRLLTIGYGAMYWVAFFYLIDWVMRYPYDEIESDLIAGAIVGFPTVLLPLIGTICLNMTKDYWKGGRKWNGTVGGADEP